MIYLTGDIHGELSINKLSFNSNDFMKDLTEEDYLIILGDFGLFWSNPTSNSEKYWLNWLSDQKYTTLFLDGNHENFNIINNFKEIDKFGGKVGQAWKNKIFHLKRGEIYTIDNNKLLTIGGAYSIDRKYRTLNRSYWDEELLSYEDIQHIEDNLKQHNNKVDYVLTHTPPGVLVPIFINIYGSQDTVAAYFNSMYSYIEFKHWYSGHLHVDQTYDKVTVLFDKIIKLGEIL